MRTNTISSCLSSPLSVAALLGASASRCRSCRYLRGRFLYRWPTIPMSVVSPPFLLHHDATSMLHAPTQPHLHLRHLSLIYIHNSSLLSLTYFHSNSHAHPTPTSHPPPSLPSSPPPSLAACASLVGRWSSPPPPTARSMVATPRSGGRLSTAILPVGPPLALSACSTSGRAAGTVDCAVGGTPAALLLPLGALRAAPHSTERTAPRGMWARAGRCPALWHHHTRAHTRRGGATGLWSRWIPVVVDSGRGGLPAHPPASLGLGVERRYSRPRR